MGAMLCTSVFDIHGQLVEEEHDGTLSAIMSAQHHWPFLLGAHLALPAPSLLPPGWFTWTLAEWYLPLPQTQQICQSILSQSNDSTLTMRHEPLACDSEA